MVSELDQIGWETGTDKSARGHNYLAFYERMLADMRSRPIRFLEIGVGDGASLRMWKRWFPMAQVIGFDINQEKRALMEDRITVEIGDQGNEDDLRRLIGKYQSFDIINDDGGHEGQQQLLSLKMLFPRLNRPGYYVLEDIGAGQTVDAVKAVCGAMCVDGSRIEDPIDTNACEFMAVFNGTAIFKK